MSLFKTIFLWGARFRNPTLQKHFADLKNSETWSVEKLTQQQHQRLFRFLEYAGAHSPYYKNLFAETGWNPGKEFNLEYFSKIPVTTKEDLLNENERIHTSFSTEPLQLCETSGTSGQVLTFRRNESWDSFNRASIMRGYSWHNVSPWDYNIYFWGYNTTFFKQIKLRFMDFLVHRYRMFSYSDTAIRKLRSKIPKAVYIEGYSSMIYELAKACEGTAIETSRLKMIKGTSEKIYPHYKDMTRKVFGLTMISEYGAAETGIIAFECKEGNMHINMEGVFVETDKDNEILVTNFHSYSFPVIRYRLGDKVQLKEPGFVCPCGMKHPVIEEVTGRIGKVIHGHTGKYPSLTFYYIFKNLYFTHQLHLNYQAHQQKKGEITILIREKIDDRQLQLIRSECRKYFNDDLHIEIRPESTLHMDKGKLRDFISTI